MNGDKKFSMDSVRISAKFWQNCPTSVFPGEFVAIVKSFSAVVTTQQFQHISAQQ